MIEIDRRESDAARAAWLYFHEDMTQGDVARELNVSRSTVTRLLQRAKVNGLVTITLNVTAELFQAERDLERAFGLERVRLVPAADEDSMQKRWLGHVAAEMLACMTTEQSVVAIGWGTTLLAMAGSLIGAAPLAGAQVVPLVGGLHNAHTGTESNEIAKDVAHHLNAVARPLLAPIYVQNEATATALATEPGIREALDLARRATVVVYSLGALHVDTTIFKLGHITAKQMASLAGRGAVGDIACRWIDAAGQAVALPASINPIGISLENLRRIPRRLMIAGGAAKQGVVLACLRGAFATAMVTDERTAEFLLRHA